MEKNTVRVVRIVDGDDLPQGVFLHTYRMTVKGNQGTPIPILEVWYKEVKE